MNKEEYIEDLESALIDLVDGRDEYDIQCDTGMSIERGKEIYDLFLKVLSNYKKKHGL